VQRRSSYCALSIVYSVTLLGYLLTRTTAVAALSNQRCPGYGDSHGQGCGMSMGTVFNPYGPMGVRWTFWIDRRKVQSKLFKLGVNAITGVWISPFRPILGPNGSCDKRYKVRSKGRDIHDIINYILGWQTVWGPPSLLAGSVIMGILWDSHDFFYGYRMSMEIEIQSPRHPC